MLALAFLAVPAGVWTAPLQQASNDALAERNAYTTADSEQNPQQKIKMLENFIRQYPNSKLMPYIYRDCYLTDYALKNFAGAMDYADRIIALGNELDIQQRLDALVARAEAYDAGMKNKSLPPLDITVHSKARDAAASGLEALHNWKKPDAMAREQFAQDLKRFKTLFKSVQVVATTAVAASNQAFEMEAPFLQQRMAEIQATESETRRKQAEFELRKKQAVELGLKPGSPEYVEYVATGKVTRASGEETRGAARQTIAHITSSPSGGEIYIDGKFFGNAPSDIALAPGEHVVRVTLGGKEWTRTVQITGGEIQLRAELP